MDEPKIMTRGACYLTPFCEHHIYEFIHVIHPENVRELIELGHANVKDALTEIVETAEVYLVRDANGDIIFVGGVYIDEKDPQMFALFSTKIGSNFKVLARGSKMLVSFFDKTYNLMTMTINARYEAMVNWAVWLGFQPVGTFKREKYQYVDFVRCNSKKNYVSDKTSRPVIH